MRSLCCGSAPGAPYGGVAWTAALLPPADTSVKVYRISCPMIFLFSMLGVVILDVPPVVRKDINLVKARREFKSTKQKFTLEGSDVESFPTIFGAFAVLASAAGRFFREVKTRVHCADSSGCFLPDSCWREVKAKATMLPLAAA